MKKVDDLDVIADLMGCDPGALVQVAEPVPSAAAAQETVQCADGQAPATVVDSRASSSSVTSPVTAPMQALAREVPQMFSSASKTKQTIAVAAITWSDDEAELLLSALHGEWLWDTLRHAVAARRRLR